ncbi:Exocyst complex component EXO70B1 [Sesamum alatum]|uniref:Exocyst complex component EXO70B1 n=1 Tax=Sesamum alatum TaxID=300844 RepID=A0AAE1YMZ5_9LAMI|nr:Exocyst complex component EXO70B1 [Sesamum alatum]
MAENGVEKLIAVARHIAKTLGHTDTMTDDILKIFSNFDGRLRERLTEKLSEDGVEQILNSLDRQISRYISSSRHLLISATTVGFTRGCLRLANGPLHCKKRLQQF